MKYFGICSLSLCLFFNSSTNWCWNKFLLFTQKSMEKGQILKMSLKYVIWVGTGLNKKTHKRSSYIFHFFDSILYCSPKIWRAFWTIWRVDIFENYFLSRPQPWWGLLNRFVIGDLTWDWEIIGTSPATLKKLKK